MLVYFIKKGVKGGGMASWLNIWGEKIEFPKVGQLHVCLGSVVLDSYFSKKGEFSALPSDEGCVFLQASLWTPCTFLFATRLPPTISPAQDLSVPSRWGKMDEREKKRRYQPCNRAWICEDGAKSCPIGFACFFPSSKHLASHSKLSWAIWGASPMFSLHRENWFQDRIGLFPPPKKSVVWLKMPPSDEWTRILK